MTGDEWTEASLAPGDFKEYTAKHVVTEADILAGEVVNVATATVESPDPDNPNPPVEPKPDPEPTDPKNGHLTLDKVTTSTPANGKTYALGEEITYKITATNDGNLTLTNVVVKDEVTGDEWTEASLAPSESKEYTAEHVVTEDDILAGEVVNVATAEVESPDPDEPNPPVDPKPDPEPTEEKKGHLVLTKVTTSTPRLPEGYELGEVIRYTITATNDGNLTLTNVVVTDEFTGDSWTVRSLAPGESVEFNPTHVVTEADVVAGTVVNVATAEADSPDPEDPKPPVDPVPDPEPVKNDYTLTINYVYEGGGTAAPTVTQTLKFGQNYSVTSPTIAGYTANLGVVAGTMPARNVTITVIYTQNPAPAPADPGIPGFPFPVLNPAGVIIDDYDTPLGLGNVSLNAGDRYE